MEYKDSLILIFIKTREDLKIFYHSRRRPALSHNPEKEFKALPYVRRPIDYGALDHGQWIQMSFFGD